MTRQEAIDTIEALYPADDDHDDCAAIGRELLAEARRQVAGWRTEPDAILIRYAQLCVQHESAEVARIEAARRRRERGY